MAIETNSMVRQVLINQTEIEDKLLLLIHANPSLKITPELKAKLANVKRLHKKLITAEAVTGEIEINERLKQWLNDGSPIKPTAKDYNMNTRDEKMFDDFKKMQ